MIMVHRVLILALLAIATVVAYSSVISSGFMTLDDSGYVYANEQIKQGIGWSGWRYAWTTFDCENWHPLTWLSLELDATLWGLNPAGYHATNLLLHVVNVLLLFLALERMTHNSFGSTVVAALFALHPLHVESVAWIAERKDVLSAFFLLITLLAYAHYASSPNLQRYLLVLLTFVLGLLAKPMLVTLPLLLLLVDFWPLDRIQWNTSNPIVTCAPRERLSMLFVEKLPLFAIAFADGLMTIRAQRDSMILLHNVTLDIRLENMFHAYYWYLVKTFYPVNLTIFYPHPEHNLSWSQVGCGIISMTLISAYVLRYGSARPHLIVGWCWFVIALLPVIGLIQVGGQAFADRYAYIPHVGLMVLIVWETESWLTSTQLKKWVLLPIAATALVASGFLTHQQASYWRSNESLWTHMIQVAPDNSMGYLHLADVRWKEHDYEAVIENLTKFLQLHHSRQNASPDAYCSLGTAYLALNRPEEAENAFIAAMNLDECHERTFHQLCTLYQVQYRHDEFARVMEQHYRALVQSLEMNPGNAQRRFALGQLLMRQGNFATAIAQFQQVAEIAPQSAAVFGQLATAQANLGHFDDAKSNFVRAIELEPDKADAHFSLGQILDMQHDFVGAKHHYAEALRLNPDDKETQLRLSLLNDNE